MGEAAEWLKIKDEYACYFKSSSDVHLRNARIAKRLLLGETVAVIAKELGVSGSRIQHIFLGQMRIIRRDPHRRFVDKKHNLSVKEQDSWSYLNMTDMRKNKKYWLLSLDVFIENVELLRTVITDAEAKQPLALPDFQTEELAWKWLSGEMEKMEENCVDNERFAYLDDAAAILKYAEIKDGGCCGFFDHEIMVGGRRATIGCNYGH